MSEKSDKLRAMLEKEKERRIKLNNRMNRHCLMQKSRLCVPAILSSKRRWIWMCRSQS